MSTLSMRWRPTQRLSFRRDYGTVRSFPSSVIDGATVPVPGVRPCSEKYETVKLSARAPKSASGPVTGPVPGPVPGAVPGSARALLSAISDLARMGIHPKSFPVMLIVGPQSSGKTRYVERLTGKAIFPVAMKMSTMKPCRITMIRSDNERIKVGDKEFVGENQDSQAREEIDRQNQNDHIKEITVVIESPTAHNLHIVDLPGLFVVAGADPALPKKIRDMNTSYLGVPNVIPVVVHSATSDPATNQALQLVNKLGRQADAFGVITKMDLVERQNNSLIREVLQGKVYPLGYGYCGVILRSDADAEAGVTPKDKVKEEEAFRSKFPDLTPFGSEESHRLLSEIQFQRIRGVIPEFLADIDKEIANCVTLDSSLEAMTNNQGGKLTARLSVMIEKLVAWSPERAEFEEGLRNEFRKVLTDHLNSIFRREHPEEFVPRFSTTPVDSSIVGYHSRHHSNPHTYKVDQFKEFSSGLLSPGAQGSGAMMKALDNEALLGCVHPLLEFVDNDPLSKKRMQWNRYLKTYFNGLLQDDNIVKMVRKITVEKLTEYIHNDPEGCDDVTKKFAEYMIKEISDEAFDASIKGSITASITVEKRPNIASHELIRHLAQLYPEQLTFQGGFFARAKRTYKLRVEMFGEPWTEAYLKAVNDKLIDNSYRNVGVTILDIFVRKLLEKTFDMVSKRNAERERSKVNEKLARLQDLRRIVAKYNSDV